MKNNIKIFSLCGFMCSGKSSLANLCSKQLQMNNIEHLIFDLDTYIEEKEKNSISEIFKQKGEASFRQKELFYLKEIIELCLNSNKLCIISLGGGCLENKEAALILSQRTTIIYLFCPIYLIKKRLSLRTESQKRPLSSQNIENLYYNRIKTYEKYSVITIDTKDKNLQELSTELLSLF